MQSLRIGQAEAGGAVAGVFGGMPQALSGLVVPGPAQGRFQRVATTGFQRAQVGGNLPAQGQPVPVQPLVGQSGVAAGGIEPPWTVAYTDSAADAPMLREAADAVLVNGTPITCRALERALGRSVRRVEWT